MLKLKNYNNHYLFLRIFHQVKFLERIRSKFLENIFCKCIYKRIIEFVFCFKEK
jgi:hypothetical protein